MSRHAVVHDTIVFERRLPVPPAKVYAAWSDAAQRALWHFPGDDGWELAEFDQDFRVGGHERSRFGPKGAPHLREEGRFLDIVPNERIVRAGTIHEDDLRISITLCNGGACSRWRRHAAQAHRPIGLPRWSRAPGRAAIRLGSGPRSTSQPSSLNFRTEGMTA